MKIYYYNSTWPPKKDDYKNKLVLYKNNWNDYLYTTTFHLVFCDVDGNVNIVGDVKIYYYDFDKERNPEHYDTAVSTLLTAEFEQLGEKFCSLGQSLSYYQNLKLMLPDSYREALSVLNDIAVNKKLKKRFINEHGVQTSLLRDSSAEKALNEADTLLATNELIEKDVSFKYKVCVPYSSEPVILKFDFKKQPEFPYRINILVGKNGTGKTQILAMLANSLSGISDDQEDRKALFLGNRPPVDKVISISYSAFDSFKKVPPYNNCNLKSYVYCGIQSNNGTLSLDMLRLNFKSAYDLVKRKSRFEVWKAIMNQVIEDEHVSLISQIVDGDVDAINWSSGQHILVCTITEVLANIEKESIILFDEPEIHLHPNAIANTMRMLYRLLYEFDSYAIFATHSPLIVQETPSAYIQVLERINNLLTVRKPIMECFGENITQIINEIFDISSSESNYKSILKKMSQRLTYEEILDLFDGRLSFNAMIFLKNCTNDVLEW